MRFELEAPAQPAAVDDRVAFKLGQWLRYIDEFDGARAQLAEAERAADEEGDEASLVNILLNRLILELWDGDWACAEEASERLTTVGDQLGRPNDVLDRHISTRTSGGWKQCAQPRAQPTEANRSSTCSTSVRSGWSSSPPSSMPTPTSTLHVH